VRLAPRRTSLEDAIRVLLVVTVVLVALGSNWSPSVRSVAQPLWRVSLAALFAASVAYAIRSASGRRLLERTQTPVYAAALAFLAVAAVSTLWSADPRLTFERGASFALVLGSAAALALASAGDAARVERLLVALAAGAGAVALLGVVVLVASPHRALQDATQTIPSRFRGIGQNPNTTAMLFAVALPLVTWLALTSAGRRRFLAWGGLALLAGSIVGSGSRGAFATAAVGALIVALVSAATMRGRVLAAATVAAALGVSLGLAAIPSPDPNATAVTNTACVDCKHNPYNVDRYFRLEDEVGNQGSGGHRTFFASTGRTQAWSGAIRQGKQRPLLGYGFGTEDHVFVDRFPLFFGGSAENSYVGMFLQLGLVGVLLLGAVALTLLAACLRAARRLRGSDRRAAAACTAALLTGLALALVQSYLYAVGNTATLTVWMCAFLGAALGPKAVAA
jgi:O-antigen ligase